MAGESITKVRNALRKAGFELVNAHNTRINGVLRGSVGFVKGRKSFVYFNTESSCYGPLSGKILVRQTSGEKDYGGGYNNFVSWEDFVETVAELGNKVFKQP